MSVDMCFELVSTSASSKGHKNCALHLFFRRKIQSELLTCLGAS